MKLVARKRIEDRLPDDLLGLAIDERDEVIALLGANLPFGQLTEVIEEHLCTFVRGRDGHFYIA